jgi:NADPH-dependent 2,4-dienoyl-CoA reductase/sulfur reductase-like enzyme
MFARAAVSISVRHRASGAHALSEVIAAAGMRLRLDTTARRIDVSGRKLLVTGRDGAEDVIAYDQLVIGTGAVPVRPPIEGLDDLGPADGLHLLHSMDDTFAIMRTLEQTAPWMRTGVPDVYAAGDCVVTHHRLLGETYLPLGTTAHKQGRVAGENACGGTRDFVGSLGTQVVKIFDKAAVRTGLRDHEALAAGYDPVTIGSEADDHKAYYPGSHRIAMRFTGDRATGRLLGVQLFGHKNAEIAKRIDSAAIAIFHGMTVDAISDLDLSYTPPLGSPWDAIQAGAQSWNRQAANGKPAG